MSESSFGPDFMWGAATAAYQIEGAAREGNRGPSIWDTFCRTAGKTHRGDSGDVACDHYHRFRDDVALMKELGLRAYRFSIAWPRIIPDGVGPTSPAGVDFYSRLVDELLDAGITPYATLYHWDLPQTLGDRGGWTNRETADRFADYAGCCVELLGDRVGRWMTLNEPQVVAWCGYAWGVHAPGVADMQSAVTVSHVLNVAHGLGVRAIRAADPTGRAQVGIACNPSMTYPADADNPVDLAAARFRYNMLDDWFLQPIFRGTYPADVAEHFATQYELPFLSGDDAELVSPPIDFLGVNNYSRAVVRGIDPADPSKCERLRFDDHLYTEMDWEVAPTGLRDVLVKVNGDYAPRAMMITENGAAFADTVGDDGAVHDELRVNYLRDHIAAAGEAMAAGVPLTGYFAWSLLDNFEWAEGYSKRFGIVRVDYRTQRRTIKDSGRWYQNWIAGQA